MRVLSVVEKLFALISNTDFDPIGQKVVSVIFQTFEVLLLWRVLDLVLDTLTLAESGCALRRFERKIVQLSRRVRSTGPSHQGIDPRGL